GATEQLQILMRYQDPDVVHIPDKTESVVCDGITLKAYPDQGAIYGDVPLKAPGAAYQCALTSHGEVATLVIPAIAPTMPTAPAPGATLARQAGFTVTYAPGSSIKEITVQARLPERNQCLCAARQTGPGTFVVDA